jgi:hypothetical protein
MLRPDSNRDYSGSSLLTPLLRFIANKCQRFYFRAVESVGHHKRDILIGRVENARDGLRDAKEQFRNALEKFTELTEFEGGELENVYREVKLEFDYSYAKALAVRDRIDAVQDVAEALFSEWEDELGEYSNRALRNASRQKMKQTQQLYGQLISAMRKAEGKIEPVLRVFHDQVLFLKHNLNAQAVAALQGELMALSVGVAGLITAMEQSINRADDFMSTMSNQKALPSK